MIRTCSAPLAKLRLDEAAFALSVAQHAREKLRFVQWLSKIQRIVLGKHGMSSAPARPGNVAVDTVNKRPR